VDDARGKTFFRRYDIQDVVHFCHAVLDQPVEALELVVGVGDLALQGGNTGIDRACFFRTP
jgi:hypothetical protein